LLQERSESIEQRARFERAMLPHLGAAYNLARWLTGSAQQAEDLAQDSYVRALSFFDGFRGEDGRAWLLAIVRNTCYEWLKKNRKYQQSCADAEEVDRAADRAPDPEEQQLRQADRRTVQESLEKLPEEYREVLVLRELEGMSYKQIARVTEAPIGTVMSRLARARKRLGQVLAAAGRQEA
jgi:RNA polymerase sigma factor (sigma-70 family)